MNILICDQIKNIFQEIASSVITIVNKNFENTQISVNKTVSTDYATETDIACEDSIVAMIKKEFPEDEVLAEEKHSDKNLEFKKRTWIIDPICGTNNLMRGIRFFCSNIAVVENQQLIASGVVDHAKGELIWSVGDNEVFVNDLLKKLSKKDAGYKIDIDLGSVFKLDDMEKQRYCTFIDKVISENGVSPASMNSSLGFAYTALGINDGFYCASPKLWDIAAAVFLIRQNGGIVTDSKGEEWDLESKDAVGAIDNTVHQKLLKLLS